MGDADEELEAAVQATVALMARCEDYQARLEKAELERDEARAALDRMRLTDRMLAGLAADEVTLAALRAGAAELERERDHWLAQCRKVTADYRTLEAACAAVRAALEGRVCGYWGSDPTRTLICIECNCSRDTVVPWPGHHPKCDVAPALATDAGRALLERVARLETMVARYEHAHDGCTQATCHEFELVSLARAALSEGE